MKHALKAAIYTASYFIVRLRSYEWMQILTLPIRNKSLLDFKITPRILPALLTIVCYIFDENLAFIDQISFSNPALLMFVTSAAFTLTGRFEHNCQYRTMAIAHLCRLFKIRLL